MTHKRTQEIQQLNDQARRHLDGCRIFITPGIQAHRDMESIINKVQLYDDFTPQNDPFNEHDFGSFQHGPETVFWKFDYYDPDLEMHSLDATDPAVTTRVLTIMLADEY